MTEFLVACVITVICFVMILVAVLVVAFCFCICFFIIRDMRYEFAIFMHNDIPEDISELTDELRKRMLIAKSNNNKGD